MQDLAAVKQDERRLWEPVLSGVGLRWLGSGTLEDDLVGAVDAWADEGGVEVGLALRYLWADGRFYRRGRVTIRKQRRGGSVTEWEKMFGVPVPGARYFCFGGRVKGELRDWVVLDVRELREIEFGGGGLPGWECWNPGGESSMWNLCLPELRRRHPGSEFARWWSPGYPGAEPVRAKILTGRLF